MPEITATDAARNFSDLLDSIEHRGEHFTIVRRGRPIAHLEPVGRGRGAEVKALLAKHPGDKGWGEQIADIRRLVEIEERS
jgi:prevent-host-death family protein